MGGVSISYVSVWGGGLAVGHEIWLSVISWIRFPSPFGAPRNAALMWNFLWPGTPSAVSEITQTKKTKINK